MALTFSVVLPYYNEARWLGPTLGALRAQSRPPDEMVLVDNASDDGSEAVCRLALEGARGIRVRHVREPRAGKIHALARGVEAASGDWLALCDADTLYPSWYLALGERLIQEDGEELVAVMALPVEGGRDADAFAVRLARLARVALSELWTGQALTGGHGQIVRRDALERAGGFSERIWPWVLLDHEVMHRVLKLGRSRYHVDLWCRPSERRADRSAVRWNLFERVLYHLTPQVLKDWYFYRFLGPRFARRRMDHRSLRSKPWEEEPRERSLRAPARGHRA